ncbi:MAG: YdeI/OmpD-associated family protein [Thermoanaerobaculia bacterium]
MQPTFFPAPADFRRWLAKHHAEAPELLVGFHKRDSGKPSLTWPESVDEALCFGWIDGVRRRIDEASYSIRFTPRKAGSVWSAVNIAKVEKLESEGRMTEAGRAAFARRRENRSGIYAYEQRPQELPAEYRKTLDESPAAARDFDSRPAGYRKTAIWKIVSAKQEATRQRRLAQLIDCHARGEVIPELRLRPAES